MKWFREGGIIRAGAHLVEAMAAATVPKLVLTVNHASGAGYYAMAGQGFDPDFILTWPTGRMGVMEGEAAVQAVYGAEAAARTYFKKPAAQLGAQESALLAAAVRNPRVLSPASPTARLRGLQQMILRRIGAVTPPPIPETLAAGPVLITLTASGENDPTTGWLTPAPARMFSTSFGATRTRA